MNYALGQRIGRLSVQEPATLVVGFLLAAIVILGATPLRAQSRSEAQMSLRIGSLEEQIRSMTGQIEQLNFEIRQMNEKLRRFSEDTEYRFQELGSGGGNRRSDVQRPVGPPPPPQYTGATVNQVPNRSSAVVGAPPAPMGALTSGGGAAAPLNINPGNNFDQLPRNFAGPNAPVGTSFANPITGGGPILNGSEGQGSGQTAVGVPMNSRTEYDVAYAFILQRDFESAEVAFSTFLSSYPGDNLSGNAQYWLGESYYARGMYRPAAEAFLKGYSNYRSGQKAPDSLLKLGLSLAQLGQKNAACSSFSELLNKFPSASPNIRQIATRESERARC